jgi:hypothetical protein
MHEDTTSGGVESRHASTPCLSRGYTSEGHRPRTEYRQQSRPTDSPAGVAPCPLTLPLTASPAALAEVVLGRLCWG